MQPAGVSKSLTRSVHLFRYLDEQACRFNTRKATDGQRFAAIYKLLTGKRLSYKKLTGRF